MLISNFKFLFSDVNPFQPKNTKQLFWKGAEECWNCRLPSKDLFLNFLSSVKFLWGGEGRDRRYQLFPVWKPEVVRCQPTLLIFPVLKSVWKMVSNAVPEIFLRPPITMETIWYLRVQKSYKSPFLIGNKCLWSFE